MINLYEITNPSFNFSKVRGTIKPQFFLIEFCIDQTPTDIKICGNKVKLLANPAEPCYEDNHIEFQSEWILGYEEDQKDSYFSLRVFGIKQECHVNYSLPVIKSKRMRND
jgi:hypothetical protein